MPIPLEDSTPIPSVKLPNLGDEVVFCIAYPSVVPWTDVATGEVKVGKDGKERTQDKVMAVVVSGNASTGKRASTSRSNRAKEVAVYLSGHHRWAYIQAKKEHGTLNVGDVCRWKYEKDEPSTLPGGNDKHVTSVKIRAPKPDEAKYVAQAEALYRRLTATVLVPAGVPDDEEDPF